MQNLSFIKNVEYVDPRFTPEDFTKASEIRTGKLRDLYNNPVFGSIRKTVDAAEQMSPKKPSSPSRENCRAAMAALRDQLKSIHSKAESQFDESVPPSSNESRLRAEIATDIVNEDLISNGSKTSVTANVRPLNKESAKARRDKFLAETGLPSKTEEGDVDFCGRVTARLRDDCTEEDQQRLVDLISCMLPWKESDGAESSGDNDDSDNEDKVEKLKPIPVCEEAKPQIVTGEDGKKYITMNAVMRDEKKDFLEDMISDFYQNQLGGYRGDENELLAMNSAPELFRLLTLRVDVPQSIGDLLKTDETKTWTDLFEGSRINFQAITRKHFFTKIVGNTVAKNILGDFDKEELTTAAVSLLASNFFSDLSLKIKQAPPSLSFGILARDAGHVCRRTAEAADNRVGSGADKKIRFAEKFASCGWENLLASFAGSFLHLGLTNKFIKERLILINALPAALALETNEVLNLKEMDNEEVFPYFLSVLQESLIKCIDSIQTAKIIGHSAEVDVEFKGLDRDAWSWLPETKQGIIDMAKPVMLANHEDWNPNDNDQPTMISAEMAEPDAFWSKDVAKRHVEEIVERLCVGDSSLSYDFYDGSMSCVEGTRPKRNTMFTVCVASRTSPNDEEWAKLLSLWGVEPIGLKSQKANAGDKKTGGDSDDSDDDMDDDEDEILGFPSPDEGYCRSACVRRKSDGRYFQFIRPVDENLEQDEATAFVNACDALVVLNNIENIGWISLESSGKRRSRYSSAIDASTFVSVPTLFVTTKKELATEEKVIKAFIKSRKEPSAPFKISSMDTVQTLPASEDEANKLLDWLVANSANPRRGLEGAEPVQAFDFPIHDPTMLP